MNLSEEYSALIEITQKTGEPIKTDEAHVIVHANNILASQDTPGLAIDAKETEYGVRATFTVKAGTVLEKPVHLCFGHLGKEGKQIIESKSFWKKAPKRSLCPLYISKRYRISSCHGRRNKCWQGR